MESEPTDPTEANQGKVTSIIAQIERLKEALKSAIAKRDRVAQIANENVIKINELSEQLRRETAERDSTHGIIETLQATHADLTAQKEKLQTQLLFQR